MFYVYVLRNELGRFYIGYSSDLRRRVREHNDGHNRSTRGHRWSLVYYEAYASELQARQREMRLKKHGRVKQLLLQRIRDEDEQD